MQEKRKQWKSKDYIQANARLRVEKKCVILLMSFLMLLLLSSCEGKGCAQDLGAGVDDFAIGLVFSADTGGDVTRVGFLDDEWKLVREYFLKYGDYANSYSPPLVEKNVIYAAPAGLMGEWDAQETVIFDWKEGSLIEYDNGENLSGTSDTAMNEYGFYVCTNLNGGSYIQYRNKDTKKTVTRSLVGKDACLLLEIAASNDSVISASIEKQADASFIYIFDARTLKTRKKIKVPLDSLSNPVIHDGIVYFSGEEDGNDSIVQLDLETGAWKILSPPIRSGIEGIIQNEDSLYILDSDHLSTEKEARWIQYDLNTGNTEAFEADEPMEQVELFQDQVYALGLCEYERGTLYRYNIEGGRLVLDRKLKITEDIFSAPVDCFFLPNP